MSAGVFNEWIEKSLAQLAVAMPGRYAKFEESSGLIESADTYSYRTPISLMPAELADATEVTSEEGEGEGEGADAVELAEVANPTDVDATEASEAEAPFEESEPEMLEPDAATPVPAAPMPAEALEDETWGKSEIQTTAQPEEANDVELH